MTGWTGMTETAPEPNSAQLADLNRWLHDPTDTRTRDELRADLRALGKWRTPGRRAMNVDVLQLMAIAGLPESDLGDVLKAIAKTAQARQEARIERRDRIRRMTTNYHRRKRGWKA